MVNLLVTRWYKLATCMATNEFAYHSDCSQRKFDYSFWNGLNNGDARSSDRL